MANPLTGKSYAEVFNASALKLESVMFLGRVVFAAHAIISEGMGNDG
ncbi:MAG: hypothetical protein KZQ89_06865 [Candidatus Thiodiazotropha sp. (ex Lucinoma kastoroae)]|nr:hypothetical protein [Candidatus Thiodiazotropha sp.]MCU7839863.1 hypothetical protein [Candidatus Thiodiazotropha sp. (ex Troendleina suluensis)]MCU7847719.1 hypothetical protein [Candidatus Thiodiazotropha sp. (ex Lucinoma kastoroae)]MCU7872437.1 hypothetical protein [Candidatus Thiodiazotropha sp. (ex Lucinoma borealis)]MCM8882821.1 hypothetical protein [Candidatus Thiodiazotropha sp.]